MSHCTNEGFESSVRKTKSKVECQCVSISICSCLSCNFRCVCLVVVVVRNSIVSELGLFEPDSHEQSKWYFKFNSIEVIQLNSFCAFIAKGVYVRLVGRMYHLNIHCTHLTSRFLNQATSPTKVALFCVVLRFFFLSFITKWNFSRIKLSILEVYFKVDIIRHPKKKNHKRFPRVL